ncbi:MAG: SAM-dependent methyltransferase, partial [Rudaea sp.]
KSIDWLDAPPVSAWRGVLIANEVIDALPVRAFALRDEGLFARGIGIGSQGEFVWREMPADAALARAVTNALGGGRSLPRPYLSEVRPMLTPWLGEVTGSLQQGSAWFIDYGYSHADYFSPQRRAGTLRCHYRHRAHDDPLILPGLQDITASVDFDALAEAGEASGFRVVEEATQARFLIAHGLDEVFAQAHAAAADESARYRLSQEVKKLTLPGQMGEVFRVMAMERKCGGE